MTTNNVSGSSSAALIPVQSFPDLPKGAMHEIVFTCFEPYNTASVNKQWLKATNECYAQFAKFMQTDGDYKRLFMWDREVFTREGNKQGVRQGLLTEKEIFFRLCDQILCNLIPDPNSMRTISFLVNRTTINKVEFYSHLRQCLETKSPTAPVEELASVISSSRRIDLNGYAQYICKCNQREDADRKKWASDQHKARSTQ